MWIGVWIGGLDRGSDRGFDRGSDRGLDTIPHRLCKSSRNRFWAPFQEKIGVWIGVRIGVPMGVRTGVWIRFHTRPEGVLDAFIEGGESCPNPYPNPDRIGVRIGVWTRFPPSGGGPPWKSSGNRFWAPFPAKIGVLEGARWGIVSKPLSEPLSEPLSDRGSDRGLDTIPTLWRVAARKRILGNGGFGGTKVGNRIQTPIR